MTDTLIYKAWSDVGPRDFVRWATPRFVKYGHVIERKDRSLLVKFIEDATPRAIPDARWYFVQAKVYGPEAEEHLVCVDYSEWLNGDPVQPFIPEATDAHELMITVNEAVEMLRIDPKQLRRNIRRGVIPAHKDAHDGMWRINRERLRDVAVKHGWL